MQFVEFLQHEHAMYLLFMLSHRSHRGPEGRWRIPSHYCPCPAGDTVVRVVQFYITETIQNVLLSFQALGVGLQNFGEQVKDQAGVGSGNPHQYSCLGNPMDIGAW